MRTRAGIALLETLVVMGITVLLMAAISMAYDVGTRGTVAGQESRSTEAAQRRVEKEITSLLRAAYLDGTTATYLIAETNGDTTLASSDSTVGTLPDTLSFTRLTSQVPGAVLASTDTFEDANAALGAHGGVQERKLSMVPTGEAGERTGLFIREQDPADGDYTQGGKERLLSPDILSIGFEFFDGAAWTATWDTTQQSTPRLPAVIRVSYTLTRDPQTTHRVAVRIEGSDVTPTNPAETGATGA